MAVTSKALAGVRTPLDHRIVFVKCGLNDLSSGEWVRVTLEGRELPARVIIAPDQLLYGSPQPAGELIDRMAQPPAGEIRSLLNEPEHNQDHLGLTGSPSPGASTHEQAFWDELHNVGRIGERFTDAGRPGLIARLDVLNGRVVLRFENGDELELARDDLDVMRMPTEEEK